MRPTADEILRAFDSLRVKSTHHVVLQNDLCSQGYDASEVAAAIGRLVDSAVLVLDDMGFISLP